MRGCIATFAAFLEIDYDNGAVNRLEPEAEKYEIPAPFSELLPRVEAALAALPAEQLHELCCGGEDDAEVFLASRPEVAEAYRFLDDYFNGWSL